jgi:DNA-binding NtrC family response regulator
VAAFPALRVLVVEDERLLRWSVGEILGQSGHTVIEASDGASAIRALESAPAPVDVVLLDYRLPDSHDLALLATIRRIAPRSAVVLMTSYGSPEIAQGALQLGAYEVLNKPFDMHEVAHVVGRTQETRPH